MQDLRAELAELVDEAEWEWLIPHAKRDAIVIVNPDLDLLDVGVAIASDNVPAVERWITEQQIYKPSPEQIAIYQHDRKKRFSALIIQPYVLVQALAAA